MPTRTRYSDDWVMGGSLSVAGSTPWRIRRPCTGAPGRDFPLDVGATATSGRRSPPEVLSAHRGKLALPPRGPCGDIGDGTGGNPRIPAPRRDLPRIPSGACRVRGLSERA